MNRRPVTVAISALIVAVGITLIVETVIVKRHRGVPARRRARARGGRAPVSLAPLAKAYVCGMAAGCSASVARSGRARSPPSPTARSLLDLLRARDRRALRARADAVGAAGVGALFLLVALSYAEGTAAIPGDGRRRDVRPEGIQRPRRLRLGWVLFLDYLIVMALAALFVPHYLGRRRLGRRSATARGTP